MSTRILIFCIGLMISSCDLLVTTTDHGPQYLTPYTKEKIDSIAPPVLFFVDDIGTTYEVEQEAEQYYIYSITRCHQDCFTADLEIREYFYLSNSNNLNLSVRYRIQVMMNEDHLLWDNFEVGVNGIETEKFLCPHYLKPSSECAFYDSNITPVNDSREEWQYLDSVILNNKIYHDVYFANKTNINTSIQEIYFTTKLGLVGFVMENGDILTRK